jgi:hypothetical protein
MPGDQKLNRLVVELAHARRELVPSLATTLAKIPPTRVERALPMMLRNVFGADQPLPSDLQAVVQGWAQQTSAPNLAQFAQRALQERRGG